MTRIVGILLLTALGAAGALASDFKPPTLEPAPRTDAHAALVKEGTALHDSGDYSGAIAKYNEVLAESPADVYALYELTYTLTTMKEHQAAIDAAIRGAQYKSDLLASFYLLIGTNLDLMSKPDAAVDAYKAGIKLVPNDELLHFNLGVTLHNQKKADDARASFKKAVSLAPDHASAHLLLASTLVDGGYRFPALFAAARFLTLEPDTDRSREGLRILDEVLGAGVAQDKDAHNITITVDPGAKKDEGDFAAMDLMLGLTRAARFTEHEKDKTEAQHLIDQMSSILAIVSESGAKENAKTFTYRYYLPYFLELKRQGFVEAFVYYVYQQSSVPGVGVWLRAHEDRVKAFLVWSKGYEWPKQV